MALKDRVKEPTILSLMAASVLAFFQFINSLGVTDNLAFRLNLIDSQNGPYEKFMIIPTGMSGEFWGPLGIDWRDYAIVGFLIYTLAGLWLHRPIDPRAHIKPKAKKKIITIRSPWSLRLGMLTFFIAIIMIANKRGSFAKFIGSVKGKKDHEGQYTFSDGSLEIEPLGWTIMDYLEITAAFLLFILAMWRAIKLDTTKLIPFESKVMIDKVWVNSDKSERVSLSDRDKGASLINEAVTDLISMVSASASLKAAGASLDQGNVRGAFNKWQNLTHKKGVQNKDWKGLSESLDDVGKFKSEDEEE
tara:strand:- start:278 stop:1189 length:912 start_codon:yes stop_codon:yes gene_type:complete